MNKDLFLTIVLLLISVYLFSQQKMDQVKIIEKQEVTENKSEARSLFDSNYIFTTRLKENKSKIQLISWTDKKTYKLSDTIKLIVESNRTFDAWPPFELQLSQCTKGATAMNTEHDNGKVATYYLINYVTKKTGNFTIPRIAVKIDGNVLRTKKIRIKINDDESRK